VNTDPYTKGWMLKVKLDNKADFDKLLSSEDYRKKTGH
jgi:glycine cleavage system H protein